MAIVLAALVAVTLLAAALSRAIVTETRAALRHAQKSQAVWLAESGVSRAAAQLHSAADYQGETWRIAADELGGKSGAVVLISVAPPAEGSGMRSVRVEARYPEDATLGVLQVKELTIQVSAPGDTP